MPVDEFYDLAIRFIMIIGAEVGWIQEIRTKKNWKNILKLKLHKTSKIYEKKIEKWGKSDNI